MFVECGAVSASSWIVRWPGCGACWLPAAARARDESWLVASASSWFLEGECLCKRKFRFFEVFEVGMVGGWVASSSKQNE